MPSATSPPMTSSMTFSASVERPIAVPTYTTSAPASANSDVPEPTL